MELEITWSRVIRVWWAYLWRYLIALIVAIIIGAIIGFILGLVGAAIGIPTGITALVAGILGGLLGLVGCIIPLKMILGKNYGEFRLVLLSTDPRPQNPTQHSQAT